MKQIAAVILGLLVIAGTSYGADMTKVIDRAATIIEEFQQIPEESIPVDVLNKAKGLAIMNVGKAGFILSARGGNGILIARLSDGSWSAPSAIGTGGGGFGFQIGAEMTDFVIVLNSEKAVNSFGSAQGGTVTLGADMSVAAGPVGRNAEVGVTPSAAIYSYSRSKGLFAGVSLEGTVITEMKKTNAAFYGKPVTANEILSGAVPKPVAAEALYTALQPYTVALPILEGKTVKAKVVEAAPVVKAAPVEKTE